MGGRRDDDGPARGALPEVPPRPSPLRPGPAPRPAPSPPASEQPRAEQSRVEQSRAERLREVQEASSPARRVWLAVGLVLAAVATAAVFLTENPLVLRIVLLAVCWAFVLAAFLGGSRGSDRVAAAAREAELRAAYDLELEREVSARHAHEAELESRLRREAEEAMRGELRRLRTQLSALDRLQDDLAAVSRLRGELDGLLQLSAQLTDLTELRSELAGLSRLQAQLEGVGDLRAELGRLRSEVTEQISGAVLVERTVMRAQSVRGPAQGADAFGGRTLEGSPDWPAEPALRPGGWDVDSWTTTRVEDGQSADDADRAPRPVAAPPQAPPAEPTRTFAVVDDEQVSRHRPPTPVEWLVGESLVGPRAEAAPRSPREWLDEQSLTGAGDPTGELPAAPAPEWAVPDRGAPARAPEPQPPRRHRRAAEPEDDLVSWTDRLRGTAPEEAADPPGDRSPWTTSQPYEAGTPWTPSYERPSDEAPSSGSTSYAAPSYESTSYGSTSYESTSYESTSYEAASSSGSPSYGSPSAPTHSPWGGSHEDASPAYDGPSYAATSHDSPAHPGASYGTPSGEVPAAGTRADEAADHEPHPWRDQTPATGPIGGSTAWAGSSDASPEPDPSTGDQAHAAPEQDVAGAPPEPAGHARLAQILAESGVAAPSGGRSRRRRYREEGQDEQDDVLARVLGRD